MTEKSLSLLAGVGCLACGIFAMGIYPLASAPLISGGLSACVASISSETSFFKKTLQGFAIGASTSLAAMPFGVLADNLEEEEVRQSIVEIAGGTIASGVGTVMQNIFEGKKVKENVASGILVGGLASGVGGRVNDVCSTLYPYMEKCKITRAALVGGLASGFSAYFATIANNLMNYRTISKEEFCSCLETSKNEKKTQELWKYLAKENDVWTLPSLPPHLPPKFRSNQHSLNILCKQHRSITNHAFQSAIISFGIGITLGTLATIVKNQLSEWGNFEEVISGLEQVIFGELTEQDNFDTPQYNLIPTSATISQRVVNFCFRHTFSDYFARDEFGSISFFAFSFFFLLSPQNG